MLQVNSTKQFVKDIELNFDPKCITAIPNAYKATITTLAQTGFSDTTIVVTDIPPTLLLACIWNSYATGLSSCVGIDFSLNTFSQQMATKWSEGVTLLLEPFNELFKQYHQTGTINTKTWNILAYELGMVWVDNCNGLLIGIDTIESIIETARAMYARINSKSIATATSQ